MYDKFDYLWDKIKHEDALFSNRANFFLVAHALLVASMSGFQQNTSMKIIIPILGILMSIIWFYCGVRNLAVQENIKKQLHNLDLPADQPKIRPEWPGTHNLMGQFIPSIFLIFWILIIFV